MAGELYLTGGLCGKEEGSFRTIMDGALNLIGCLEEVELYQVQDK